MRPPPGVAVYAALWGLPELTSTTVWPAMFARLATQNFEGVEIIGPGPQLPFKWREAEFRDLLKQHNLKLIMQVHTCDYPVGGDSVADHIKSLRRKVHEAAQYDPIVLNCHSGKDAFSRRDALTFFTEAVKIEKEVGIPLVHATQRQRILHSPFVLRDLARELPPTLKLNADLSHWVAVLERIMCPQRDAAFWPAVFREVSDRSYLIHARVGQPAGAVVSDPCSPAANAEVQSHIDWWRELVLAMKRRNTRAIVVPGLGPNGNYPSGCPDLQIEKDPVAPDAYKEWSALLQQQLSM